MMSIRQPPFPGPVIPTEVTGEAIVEIGLMFAHILILVVLMILMVYCYRKYQIFLVVLVVYLFSIVIGFMSFEHAHTPFSPMFEIFFLLFQTTFFIVIILENARTPSE